MTPRWDVVCDAPVAYVGAEAVRSDIVSLEAALAGVDVEEAFLPSTAPRDFGRNEYYGSEEEYLYAIATALRRNTGRLSTPGWCSRSTTRN